MAETSLTTSRKITIASPVIVLGAAAVVLAAMFSNGVYLAACILTSFTIIYLLWKDTRPAVLVFSMLMQWVQVVAFVIWMNNFGFDINRTSPHGGTAVLMACAGIIVMCAVMGGSLHGLKMPTREEFEQQARLVNEKKILYLYLFSTFFLGSIGLALRNNAGFDQILMTLASFKWIFFMVYGYVAWVNKKNRFILVLIVLFEFSSGLYSYFSNFKEVIFYTILIALTFVRKISFKQVCYGIVVGVALLFILLTWTAIKGDYRQFLNQGKKQQVVEVSRSEAFTKIGDKVSNITWDDYQKVIGAFLYRTQYILHLARTMDRVPALMPYEYGNVWWGNISFVLMPRLFFPDKPIYQATVKTVKYTGITYAGFNQGTSFSLGYFADSYIDFGYVGMMLPLSLIALFVVFIYKKLYAFKKINVLLRYAVINTALIQLDSFEQDGLFLFGRLLLMFLVFWFLSKYVLGRLQKWLYKPSSKTRWI
ncbi:hypothetical protein [Puia sp.]|jgi:hypothetical protein|uniref:hypothetical protein n=1 Tax=Puia sp. TaxID=2045100 RepID=UPI002F411141